MLINSVAATSGNAASTSSDTTFDQSLMSCKTEAEMISLLKNDNFQTRSKDGDSPLRIAVRNGWRRAIEKMHFLSNDKQELINQDCDDTCRNHPILSECRDEKTFLLLLKRGADVKADGCKTIPPLMRAAIEGWNKAIIEIFKKTDPAEIINFENRIGQTALVRCKTEETALLLLEFGADSKIGKYLKKPSEKDNDSGEQHRKTFEEIADENGWEKVKKIIGKESSHTKMPPLRRRLSRAGSAEKVIKNAEEVIREEVGVVLPGQMPESSDDRAPAKKIAATSSKTLHTRRRVRFEEDESNGR